MKGPQYKGLWNKFRDTTVINRCEQYAHWTLPYLMADILEVSSTGRVVVERDYQEIGALLTNNLAAKLIRILFPTQYPFFQASATAELKQAAAERGVTPDGLNSMFAQLEMASNKRLFVNAGYAALMLAAKHLIVTGQVLLYRDSDKGTMCAWGLPSFVTKRDGTGELLDCILREFTCVEALPPDLQNALRAQAASKYARPEQQVEKFTRIHREYLNGVCGYRVSQQVDCIDVGESSWYPKNLCPWMVPTWTLIPGEHYARGMVEDYAGGFARLSSLSESAALYGVEMSKVIHLVGGASGTDVDELADAESGEYVRGDPSAITAHEAGDARKLEAITAEAERVFQRLAKAFMYTGIARQAERVTAFELSQEAAEAEHTLGGVYSTLSGGIQVPLAHILMTEVSDAALPGLITGDLAPDVTAGIPALGRSSDVQNILLASQEAAAVIPVWTQVDKRVSPQRLTDVILAGRSIDPKTIFYTPEEQQANAEAEQAALAAQANLAQGQALAQSGDQIAQTLGAT